MGALGGFGQLALGCLRVDLSESRDLRSAGPRSLAEYVVLAVVAEAPVHGFAIARLVAPGAPIGQIYTIRRPIVYRALARLLDVGLIEVAGFQVGEAGPQRTAYRVSPAGSECVLSWLATPVAHTRQMRTDFLAKLVLRERAGLDIQPLIRAQRATLAPIVEALKGRKSQVVGSAEQLVIAWRLETALATLRFLDQAAVEP
jgi:DNA-binding PadR family transcriptional regulator